MAQDPDESVRLKDPCVGNVSGNGRIDMKPASTVPRPRAHKKREPDLRQVPPEAMAEPPPAVGVVSEPDQPFEEGAHDMIDADLRHRLISEAAFEMYEKRGFVDGYDVEDWLSAEAQVDHLLLNPQFS